MCSSVYIIGITPVQAWELHPVPANQGGQIQADPGLQTRYGVGCRGTKDW